MRTSLNKLFETEQFLNKQLGPEDELVFQARLLVEADLNEQMLWQQRTYSVVRAYGRMQLRDKLERMHNQFMTAPEHTSFRNNILQFFSR
ncbi:hypothetical protein [Cytophaga aurantiaca]|uniref:hypothetical protein n=1 Tax=Cytophaga aurantiaca TaxID=29530 RepID=UPI00039F1E7E|nr:hypothetical protein [Cytophaga aurantiaca]